LRELRTLEVVFLISREEQEQRANNVGNNWKIESEKAEKERFK
jgi:hypothetical protein